jgi:hypothetical protein
MHPLGVDQSLSEEKSIPVYKIDIKPMSAFN